ncbi:FG-GAP repeat domain-containing protein [Myxococcota bacterium]
MRVLLSSVFCLCVGCQQGIASELNNLQTGALTSTALFASPSGSGSACTQVTPCSLAGAQQRVLELNDSMTGDIVVNLQGGTYNLTSTFVLQADDSGNNGHNVIYRAAPGAAPVLSGGTTVTDWSLYDATKNIYRAQLGTGLQTRQLYYDPYGTVISADVVRGIRARGALNPSGFGKSSFGWYSNDPSLATWGNPGNVEVVSYQQWKAYRCPVATLATGDVRHNSLMQSTGSSFSGPSEWSPSSGEGTTYYIGDFTGDGKSDILLTYAMAGQWHNSVMQSTGSGFLDPVEWSLGNGEGTTYHVGDFTGDGKSDVLLTYYAANQWHNSVMQSTGSSFMGPVDWSLGNGDGTTYHIGDFTGDGKSDVLLTYYAANQWHNSVMQSTGSSFMGPVDWSLGNGDGTTYHIGDFTGDGKSDILLTYAMAGQWHNSVMQSTGSSFLGPADWSLGNGDGTTYHVGDFTGDGKSDILLTYAMAGQWHNSVMQSTGSSFLGPADWSLGNGDGTTYHIGEFTGDGKGDILLTYATAGSHIEMQEPCWTNAQGHTVRTMDRVTWLENAYELLDAEGEWYHDQSTGYLYYKPRQGESLTSGTITVATLESLITGNGHLDAGGNPVFLHNVHFEGLTFAFGTWLKPSTGEGYPEGQAGWQWRVDGTGVLVAFDRTPGNLSFSWVKNLRFERNGFVHLGAVGLDITSGQNNAVVGNVFKDISSAAVQVGNLDSAPSEDKKTKDNTVANNYVTQVAAEYQSAVGISFLYTNGADISHNEVANLPYTGISVGWGWDPTPTYAGNNEVNANRVHDVMLVLRDGGALYTLSDQPGSSTNSNYFYAVGPDSDPLGHNCLYHDQGTGHYTDTYNVLENRVNSPWLSMWATDIHENTIGNNYFAYDVAFCSGGTTASQSSPYLCNFSNNITTPNYTIASAPAVVQDIMNVAGLEPTYQDIKNRY